MARKKQTNNPIVFSDGSVDDGKGRIVTTSDGRKVKVDALASSEYWRRREARQQTKNIRDEQKIGEEMKKIYLRMFRESRTQIDAFYQRYADKNGITLAEARKRVSQMDINAYAAKAKKYVKDRDLSDQANEEMALYNLTMKVNRLEMLKAEMGMALVDGFEEMSGIIDRELTERAMSEYERKAGILGKTVQNSAAKAAAIVNASFHNATWSERLWSHQEALKTEIGRQLMSGLIAGKSSRDMAREIRKIFGGSLQNAQRLMVTELARVQTEAARQSMEANGNTEYEYMATGPHPCPECMKLDGEIFKLKEMQVGVNAPPLHPSCHCCTAPYAGRMRARLMGIDAEPDKYYMQNEQDDGIINVEIDELVPCLRDTKTGEIVDTVVVKVNSRSELKGLNKKNGWYVNWSQAPGDVEIYKLLVKNSSDIQGLIGIVPKDDHKAVYLHWAVAAPHNNPLISKSKRYEGVGGHLFAVAAEQSIKAGYGGAMYGFAANKDLVDLYVTRYGARHLPIEHRYEIFFDEQASNAILKEYTYELKG